MMMSSTFLETAGDGDAAARFGRMSDDWMNSIDTTAMPFSGLDASYEASTVSPYSSPTSRETLLTSVSATEPSSVSRDVQSR